MAISFKIIFHNFIVGKFIMTKIKPLDQVS